MAQIDVLNDTARQALANAARRLVGDTRRLLLMDWGEYLLRATRERAKLEQDPDGRKWRALEPSYKRWKQKKRPGVPILKFDFHMLGDQLSWQPDGDDALLVGTNAKYGAIHQFGGVINRAARSTHVHLRTTKRGGRFVKATEGNAKYRRRVTLPAYKITMPARPFLGVSSADEKKLLDIAEQHVSGAFDG